MSDVTNLPRQSYFRATLQSPITAVQTTGIILSEQLQAISGTVYLNLLDPNNVETISCTGQSGTGELTGVTRAVATYSGETATAYAHGAGITIVLSDDWNYWQAIVTGLNDKVDIGGDTMTGLLQFSGTTNPGIKMNSLTTAQRDALSAANGEVIYNTTTSELNVYQGGAWVAIASGSTQPNGSTTVAGKYQTATVAQQLAATATGSTGAQLVPVTANMVTTSAGAGDAGKIAVLNASGVFENSVMNAATTGASKTLISKANSQIDDSLLALTTAGDTVYSDGTDLQRLAIGTSGQILSSSGTAPQWTIFDKITLATSVLTVTNTSAETAILTATVPANTLGTGNGILFNIPVNTLKISNNPGRTLTLRLKYGSTTIVTHTATQGASALSDMSGTISGYLFANAATNAQVGSLNIDLIETGYNAADTSLSRWQAQQRGTSTEDSTGALTLQITIEANATEATTGIITNGGSMFLVK